MAPVTKIKLPKVLNVPGVTNSVTESLTATFSDMFYGYCFIFELLIVVSLLDYSPLCATVHRLYSLTAQNMLLIYEVKRETWTTINQFAE